MKSIMSIIIVAVMLSFVGCASQQKDVVNNDQFGLIPAQSDVVAKDFADKITEGRIPKETTYSIEHGPDNYLGDYLAKELKARGYAVQDNGEKSAKSIPIYWWVYPYSGDKETSAKVLVRVMAGDEDWSRIYDAAASGIEPATNFSKGVWE